MSNNKQIPTAKELFDGIIEANDECSSIEMIIEFAKLHVEAALNAAADNADVRWLTPPSPYSNVVVDITLIYTSYPLENIK